jgi:hypothetical protein
MSKEEALNAAHRLVQEAMDIAHRAGIDPSSIVAPHCPETTTAGHDGDGLESQCLLWCGIPVIVDNNTDGLFEMPEPDNSPEQKPFFRVTQSTSDLVRQDFVRYKSALERMVENWQEEKARLLSEKKAGEK